MCLRRRPREARCSSFAAWHPALFLLRFLLAEVGVSRLEEKSLTKVQTKQVQLFDFCFRKINTGFCKSKNKVFSLLYCSCVVKDQWRVCNGNLVQQLCVRPGNDVKSIGGSFILREGLTVL